VNKKLCKGAGILAAAVVFGLVSGVLFAREAKLFVGDWEGAVLVEGQEIALVCHFSMDEGGMLTGTLDSPDQGAFGLALADIAVEGRTISFGIDDPNVPGDPLFEGVLDDSGKKISGEFWQGEGEGTFELTKK